MIEGILWQGVEVSKKQQEENFEWIRDYNENSIQNGHLTSSADPFIMLVAYLLRIEVIFIFNGYRIVIYPPGNKDIILLCVEMVDICVKDIFQKKDIKTFPFTISRYYHR